MDKIKEILSKAEYRDELDNGNVSISAALSIEQVQDMSAQLQALFDKKLKKEKALMFNPDWKPDVQAILKEFNEAVAQIKADCDKEKAEIFEEIDWLDNVHNNGTLGNKKFREAILALKKGGE